MVMADKRNSPPKQKVIPLTGKRFSSKVIISHLSSYEFLPYYAMKIKAICVKSQAMWIQYHPILQDTPNDIRYNLKILHSTKVAFQNDILYAHLEDLGGVYSRAMKS